MEVIENEVRGDVPVWHFVKDGCSLSIMPRSRCTSWPNASTSETENEDIESALLESTLGVSQGIKMVKRRREYKIRCSQPLAGQ